jgi:hypothetical protein
LALRRRVGDKASAQCSRRIAMSFAASKDDWTLVVVLRDVVKFERHLARQSPSDPRHATSTVESVTSHETNSRNGQEDGYRNFRTIGGR